MSTIPRTIALTAAVLFGASTPALAQIYGMGSTTQGSITYSGASAIAKTVVDAASIQIRVQPYGGSTQYVPLVNSGELDFGMANVLEVGLAVQGKEIFRAPNDNLRVIGAVFPLRVGYFVRKDSPIKTLADLKGRPVPVSYSTQAIIRIITEGLLATDGITSDDLQGVPVPNVVRGADDFAQGRADSFFFGIGGAKVAEVDAAVGGARLLPMGDDLAAMREHVPQAYRVTIKPSKRTVGAVAPTPAMAYDYLLFTNKNVPEDVVYQVTRAVHQNKKSLAGIFGVFNLFQPEEMGKDLGLPYHPGAIRYFKEAGIWKR